MARPTYRLTRAGMSRPAMELDAIACVTGGGELPEGLTLVELEDCEWPGFKEYGPLVCFVISDDEDYLAETLPEGLLPTGANYVCHRGLYAHVAEGPAEPWTVESYLSAVLGRHWRTDLEPDTRHGLDEWLGKCEAEALGDDHLGVPPEIRRAALDRLAEEFSG